jgi:hypothetical protein
MKLKIEKQDREQKILCKWNNDGINFEIEQTEDGEISFYEYRDFGYSPLITFSKKDIPLLMGSLQTILGNKENRK